MPIELAVALDCDGVILDSNAMKTTAFSEVLRGYPPTAVERFLAFQRRSFGMSRYRLFEQFFDEFHRVEIAGDEMDGLLARFGEVCSREYLKVPTTEGALTALEAASQRWPLYVCSGSDQSELRHVFEQRGLTSYFRGIYGSPTPKSDLVASVLAQEPDRRLVFVGDASADWEAARTNAVPFVFMTRYSNERDELTSLVETAGVPQLRDLRGLLALLQLSHATPTDT